MPDEQPSTPSISVDDIASAEKLIGLTFSAAEREQMLEVINERAKHYAQLRETALDNSVPPALIFDPRSPAERSSSRDVRRGARMSVGVPVARPAKIDDLAFAPVTQLAELIRTRQVTSLELTEMYLARLKRFDPHLHCIVTLTEDLAYAQASRADAEIAAGNYRGALHGIPWGAKDLLAVRGYPTTWGAEPYRDQVIDLDATVVQRLEAAGAVLVAKLTLGALAYGDLCFDTRTLNPWNLAEGSSGSSAGSASAAAAGLVGFAIGTETLGSIVSPSTRCGTTGLRPTAGRVSRHGAMALSWSMDKIGPICRTVEDCALVFDAIYGPDGEDGSVVDAPFTWNPDVKPTELRIGYAPAAYTDATDTDRAVLEVVRGLGVELVPLDLPQDDLAPLFLILLAEGAAAFDDLTRSSQDDLLTWQDKEAWPNSFRAARFISAVEYIQANRVRTLLMRKMAAIMQTVDVIISPPFAGNILTLTNLTGNPCVVLPNGFAENGSPTSATFIGGLYREAEVMAVAKAYQDATDFHRKHPAMNYAG